MRAILLVLATALCISSSAGQQKLLILMDLQQSDHLKAYGIAYWTLSRSMEIDWLLNYRGGSFMMEYSETVAAECRIRGVAFERVEVGDVVAIYSDVQREDNNMDVVRLEKPPKIA
ncbi:MAG: asparagine synthetase B, partial [Bacteroidetes bacterium]|nr:asparagine synthetase B [Bacteroidota bacterium]